MEKKHTPGPWKVVHTVDHPFEKNNQVAFIQMPNICLDVCAVEIPEYTREEHEANARLIAAAPELVGGIDKTKGCIYSY